MLNRADVEELARGMDRHSAEQQQLLRLYHLERAGGRQTEARWSADGPHSIAPFVPCASARVGPALAACQLSSDDVLWDLGCGDGRLLHQAAAQYGCRCVGVDIDAACIAEARHRAEEQQVAHLCTFEVCDLLALEPASLSTGRLGKAAQGTASAQELPQPTALLMFLTGHGLTRIASLLHAAWLDAGPAGAGLPGRRGLRIVTCMEALDSLLDYEAGASGLFDEPAFEWPVCHAFASDGIFVVPPIGTSAAEWAERLPPVVPTFSPTQADETELVVLKELLTPEQLRAIIAFGEGVACQQSMDRSVEERQTVRQSLGEAGLTRIFLHRGGAIQLGVPLEINPPSPLHEPRDGVEGTDVSSRWAIDRMVAKLVAAIHRTDAARWRLLVGRSAGLRCVAYDCREPDPATPRGAWTAPLTRSNDGSPIFATAAAAGTVAPEDVRDTGSLITLRIRLSNEDESIGGEAMFAPRPYAPATESVTLRPGDGVLFASERRYRISSVDVGRRRDLVLEIWEGPPNLFDRHS